MIYFEEDWAKYPGAVIHDTTKNISFLRTSQILGKMGVKNNKFMLALSQPHLARYDPHNLTDNSLELKLDIARECKINPWYFFREVLRITEQGSDPVMFRLDRGNLSFIWLFKNFINAFIMQARQTGKSIGMQALLTDVVYISGKNLNIGMLTKDTDLLKENVNRCRVMRDSLPPYLIAKSTKDSDNKEGLYYNAHNVNYQTYVAQSSKDAAASKSRGMTMPVSVIDEIGYCINIGITYPNMMAAMGAAIRSAALNDQPHSNLFATTAPRIDSPEGKFVYENIILPSMPFSVILYDVKDREELKAVVSANSKNDIVSCIHSYLQLGYSHQWLQETIRRVSATKEEVDRDFLNILKAGTDNSVLPIDLVAHINTNKKEPLYVERDELYTINWYVPRETVESPAFRAKSFIMGMDGSENVQRDFTAFTIIDIEHLSVVARMECNDVNIMRIGFFVLKMLMKYTKLLFIPERNSIGVAVVDQLLEYLMANGINPFTRIYNTVIQNYETDPSMMNFNFRDMRDVNNARKYFGFRTTENSRYHLYQHILIKAVELNKDRIYDNNLITELSTLTNKSGRVVHGTNSHDDLVIAYLLSCFVVFSGKNLYNYCIDTSRMLSTIDTVGTTVSKDRKEYQMQLRHQIKALEDTIKRTEDPNMIKYHEMTLKQLKKEIDTSIVIEPIGHEQVNRDMGTFVQGFSQYLPNALNNRLDIKTVLNSIW